MEEAPSPEAKKPKIERKDQAREAIESTWKANRRKPKHIAQTIESALFHSTDLKSFTNMRYCDGRLAYFCCEDDSNTSTTFCCEDDSDTSTTTLILDLFTGTKRVLKNPKGNFSLQNAYPIKGDYFLKAIRLNGNFKQIQVFQVDRNNWSIKEVGFYDVSSDLASFIVDPMNYRKFLFWSNEQFQLGGTEDNKLIAGPTRHYLIGELIYPKLDGHKLLGFRERTINNFPKRFFVEIDLIKREETSTEIDIETGPLTFNSIRMKCWQGNTLYVNRFCGDGLRKFYAFNSDTKEWRKVNVQLRNSTLYEIFVNPDGFLTLHSCFADFDGVLTTYRFALRKPDSLKNIAWFKACKSKRPEVLRFCQNNNIMQSVLSK